MTAPKPCGREWLGEFLQIAPVNTSMNGTTLRHSRISVTCFGRLAISVKFNDLTQQRFGRLRVIGRAGTDKWGGSTWNTLCDCGGKKVVPGSNLRGGHTQSCGCLHREYLQGKRKLGNPARNQILLAYQSSPKGWNLSEARFDELTQQNCRYCGAPPANRQKSKTSVFIYNGIDRIDSTRGYEEGNVAPCCKLCNRAKSDLSVTKFIAWAKRVVQRARKRN